jgi:hypothetical protein
MVTLQAEELGNFNISPPKGMDAKFEVTLYGGATLIFDECEAGREERRLAGLAGRHRKSAPRAGRSW